MSIYTLVICSLYFIFRSTNGSVWVFFLNDKWVEMFKNSCGHLSYILFFLKIKKSPFLLSDERFR